MHTHLAIFYILLNPGGFPYLGYPYELIHACHKADLPPPKYYLFRQ
jgi:hypothetical protein